MSYRGHRKKTTKAILSVATVDSNNCSELMEYILCSCINGDASVVNVLITTTEPSVLAFVSLSALYETKIPKISVNRTTNR